ncbi:hypothetical protein AKJ09_11058 [Labilithrix luteola]|uniref:Uncharacterized protein n=1 Tax=Labilithrix luteola TaxID=1391654 RepID=A0A0K1QG34_9BACT|nr:hypothetical protein [Labilithrix luteola]AKV04395.1 hypothetical protein AKJ09_11058 [Labilithrix luteola]
METLSLEDLSSGFLASINSADTLAGLGLTANALTLFHPVGLGEVLAAEPSSGD